MPLEAAAAPVAQTVSSAAGVYTFARKSALAVSDQALFSGANFLVNILLARWLAPAEYGAFSLAYTVFLFFAVLHSAVLIEPMMVFGSGKYRPVFGAYLRVLVGGHLAMTAAASLLLFAVAMILERVYSVAAGQALIGLAWSAAAILLFWLVRRVFYVLLEPGRAVAGGAIYFVVLMGGVAGLQSAGWLTTTTAFLAMGLAGGVASLALLARFQATRWEACPASSVVKDHWRYGKWAVASSAISWFPGSIYYMLLPAWLGLEATAGLRALMNFIMPVLQAISALGMLLLPTLVRDRDAGGPGGMNRTMLLFLGLFCTGALVYGVALFALHHSIFSLFYAGKYAQYAGLPFLLAALLPLGTCATAVLGDGLRALERPDRTFWCYLGSAVSSLAVGIPLARSFGITGALIGLHISSIVTAALMGWFYLQQRRLACVS